MPDVKSLLDLRKLTQPFALDKVLAPVASMIGRARDAEPRWCAPHSWAAADGLYANDTEAWLYRQLPAAASEPGSTLVDDVLAALLTLGDARPIHVLAHAWDGPTAAPAGTPERLASFQEEALRFPAPVRAVFVGVQLRARTASAATGAGALVAQVVESVDTLLGEAVPDLGVYDDDRAAVGAIFDAHGATPPERAAGVQLESWYLLGVSGDARAIEYDDYVAFDGAERLELAAVTGISAAAAVRALPAAGWRGATVASARGELAALTGTRAGVGLARTSVILGRRASQAPLDWPTQLRDLTGVVIKPLPLRQLAALHETMPCSPKRLSATLQNVDGGALARVGFADPHARNLSGGLLVGMSGAHLTQPLFVEPVPAKPVTLLIGGPRAGKSIEAEMLATQAVLGDMRVLYLSGDGSSGDGMLDLVGGSSWAPATPGDLDPYRFAAPADATALLEQLTASLPLPLTAAERDDLAVAFRRARAADVAGLPRVLELAGGVTAVAHLRRALARDPQLGLFAGDSTPQRTTFANPVRVDLRSLEDPIARDLAVAVLTTHAISDGVPTMLVLDGLDDALTGPATQSALGRAATGAGGAAHVVIAVRDGALVEPLVAYAGLTLVLAHDHDRARAALGFAGAAVDDARLQWLAAARARIADQLIEQPPLALSRTDAGPVSVLLGPWPKAAVATITRGEAVGYAADR